MVQSKMATAELGFELCMLKTMLERTDMEDGPKGKIGTSETPPKPLQQGRATVQLVMGSREITMSTCGGSLRGRTRNE